MSKNKKLRDGPVIQVSDQIIRWRQKMAKSGKVLGKHMAKQKEVVDAARETRQELREEERSPEKKKYF